MSISYKVNPIFPCCRLGSGALLARVRSAFSCSSAIFSSGPVIFSACQYEPHEFNNPLSSSSDQAPFAGSVVEQGASGLSHSLYHTGRFRILVVGLVMFNVSLMVCLEAIYSYNISLERELYTLSTDIWHVLGASVGDFVVESAYQTNIDKLDKLQEKSFRIVQYQNLVFN